MAESIARNDGMSNAAPGYHDVRFPYDARRAPVWRQLARYLQRFVDPTGGLLELGAGYGEFSSVVDAGNKWGLDLNPDLTQYWSKDIVPLIQSALDPLPLADRSVATVFASNFFEHFVIEDAGVILAEAARVLRPGGKLIAVQPNYRLQPHRYFDDYTHKQAYTESSFSDYLTSLGWKVRHCEARFMPFTMKSSLPTWGWLVAVYLALPYRPLAGQFLIVAEAPEGAS